MFGTGERSTLFTHPDETSQRTGNYELLQDPIEHVQFADPDAELLDRSRKLRAYLPVKVITFDTGMALRGRAAGLDIVLTQAERE